jgi:hypothetical protein
MLEQDELQLAPAIEAQLNEFLVERSNNRWLMSEQVEVYVRKSRRLIGGVAVPMLDLANITVAESLRRRGLFKQVFALLQSKCADGAYGGVFIENVLASHLRHYLHALVKNDPSHYWWRDGMADFFWLTQEHGGGDGGRV